MKKLLALTLALLMLVSFAAAELQITLDEFLNIYNWHPLNQTGTIGAGSMTKSQAFSGYDDYTCYASPLEKTIVDFGVAPDGSLVHATAIINYDLNDNLILGSLEESMLTTLALFGAAAPSTSDKEVFLIADTLIKQTSEKIDNAPNDNVWLSELEREGLVYQNCVLKNEAGRQMLFRVNFRPNSFSGL